MHLLLDLNRREGTTLVLVTHDPAVAENASRIITVRDGAILSDTANISMLADSAIPAVA